MTPPIDSAAGDQLRADDQATPAKASRFEGLSRWWNGLERWQQWGVLAIVALALYLLPVINPPLISTESTGYNFPIVLCDMARFVLVALGLNVVVGQAGLLDLGYIGFFAIGSYVAALWTSTDSTMVKIPYLATLPLAMIVTGIFGILIGVPTLRLRGDYLAIVTLGFGEIIRLLATIIPALKGNTGFQNLGSPPGSWNGTPIFTITNGTPWYWLFLTVIIIAMLLLGNLERSRVGRAWIAIREDEDAAEVMGVPTFKFKLWAFCIGAGIGGLSGALYSGQIGFVNNQKFDVATSMLFIAAVVMGGAGNKFGAAAGGALVAYLPYRFTFVADQKYLLFGVILVMLMIFRPQGLFGARNHLLAYASKVKRVAAKLRRDIPATAKEGAS